jgi:hypothetical protein
MESTSEWMTGPDAWEQFVKQHPELGYRAGQWPFHNFLRLFREALVARDALRKARGRHWIAHKQRFMLAAFDCASGGPAVQA